MKISVNKIYYFYFLNFYTASLVIFLISIVAQFSRKDISSYEIVSQILGRPNEYFTCLSSPLILEGNPFSSSNLCVQLIKESKKDATVLGAESH